jgi:hypothetical protein
VARGTALILALYRGFRHQEERIVLDELHASGFPFRGLKEMN